jgi:hypothetical protein
MKSWKTTLFGLMAALGAAALTVDGLPPWALTVCKLSAALGLAGMGFCARDNDKSSEQVGVSNQVPVKVVSVQAHKPSGDPRTIPLFALLALALLPGCARFSCYQEQTRPDGVTVRSRQSVTTFLDGKSEIAKVRASSTDKSTGLTVGSIAEESSSEVIDRVVKAAVSAAASAVK